MLGTEECIRAVVYRKHGGVCESRCVCVCADVSVTVGALGWEQVQAQCFPLGEGDAQEEGRVSSLCPQELSAQGSGGLLRRQLLSGPQPGTKTGVSAD